ncbi:MAG TPA: peptidylprolyl isomerase [Nitrospira sp.]|jgi:peptidyl-prolyl cis-trans isomerase B (cyclophilin B)|nr:peptidylprolyl isomerase [Nitrospira sp.]
MVRPFEMSRAAPGRTAALLCALIAVSVLGGCGGKAETKVFVPPPPPPGPKAIIKTRFGEIEMKFYPELAPKHVENFIKLAKSGFYNGTIFHRVIPGFMIQGGDPNTKNSLRKETYGQGGPKDEKGNPILLKAEFTDTPHKRGIVSMARAGEPDTAGSQFFIVVEDSFFLDRKYTVFGEVTKGLGVADKIANLPRNDHDLPNDRTEMNVTIVE